MAAKPETTANTLNDEIGALLARGLIVSQDSPEVVGLFRAIDKLDQANHAHAVEMRALLMHITGDLDGALSILDECQECDPRSRLVLLSNYSKCRSARPMYAELCGPESGLFTLTTHIGRSIGAFRLVAEFMRRAQKMGLSNLDKLDSEGIFMADRILSGFGISDEITGGLMETAGSILAEHGLMFFGDSPEVDVLDIPGELRTVHVTYRIATTASTATDMYLEFVERLFEKEQTLPRGFHISFEGCASAG